jgi:cobaltochelatase CobS
MDGLSLSIPKNEAELIKPYPMFRFVATAHANGSSEDTSVYQGILRQKAAFMARFWLREIGYPKNTFKEEPLAKITPELPAGLIAKRSTTPGKLGDCLWDHPMTLGRILG